MYMCMYVCMSVCLYECGYVCMYVCVSMYECLYVLPVGMHVCLYVYVRMFSFVLLVCTLNALSNSDAHSQSTCIPESQSPGAKPPSP